MRYNFILFFMFFSILMFADEEPPYVEPLYPASNAVGIPVNTDITFHMYDDEDGVDINSVEVAIDSIIYDYTSGYFFFSGSPQDFIITINPPNNFQFEQIVNIQIDGQDLANPPNVMDSYSYYFQCIEDLQPPYVGELDPQMNATNVAFDTNVAFHIYDSGVGVNISSVLVTIQNVNYTHNDQNFNYSGNPNDYNVEIDVPVNFGLGDTVFVQINADDINGMTMSEFSYEFFVIEDVEPPYTGEWQPQPNSTNNPIDTDVSFNIYDNIEGVDINSVEVVIDDVLYTHLNTSFSYFPISNGYSITIDLVSNFVYNDSVSVAISGNDLAQPSNFMQTYNFQFFLEIDDQAPYLENILPEPGSNGVPLDSNIEFNILDNETGVDITSLLVEVNDSLHNINSGNLTYTGDPDDYRIILDLQNNFVFGQQIQVNISAADQAEPANLLQDFSFNFLCYEDAEPPTISEISPTPNSSEIPLDSNISFHLQDIGYGVDIDSVQVIVNDILYSVAENNLYYSGSIQDYFIEINPDNNFSAGDTVNVSIEAADLASPSHQMPTYNFSFQCLAIDQEAPFVWGVFPENGAEEIPANTSIRLHISDEISGVDSASINFQVENEIISAYSLSADSSVGSGYRLVYQPDIPFTDEQIVNVSVTAQDLAIIPNMMQTYEFSFQCKSEINTETIEERVEIVPHVVSWNDENCEIKIFTTKMVEEIECRILNRKGRQIAELSTSSINREIPKIYLWNKRDHNGKKVSGGFYIYQVRIQKKIYQGSVIIAR